MNTLKKTIVYKAVTPSNKIYIGITSQDLKERIRCHFKDARKNKNRPWHNALRKYGSNITWEVLAEFETRQEARVLEIKLISEYKTQDRDFGYNYTAGGDGFMGIKHTIKTREKISAHLKSINHGKKEYKYLEEYYAKNPEKRREISIKMYQDNPHMRELNRIKIQKHRANGLMMGKPKRPVVITKDCVVLEFNSLVECAKFLNCCSGNISQALKNNGTAKGFKVYYLDSI